jgi:hypothetical protein
MTVERFPTVWRGAPIERIWRPPDLKELTDRKPDPDHDPEGPQGMLSDIRFEGGSPVARRPPRALLQQAIRMAQAFVNTTLHVPGAVFGHGLRRLPPLLSDLLCILPHLVHNRAGRMGFAGSARHPRPLSQPPRLST